MKPSAVLFASLVTSTLVFGQASAAMPQKAKAAGAKATTPKKKAETAKPAAVSKADLKNERDRIGYMVGMDVGRSLADVGPELEFNALERAIGNAIEGGKPLIAQEDLQPTAAALAQRVKARKEGAAVPPLPAGVTAEKASWLIGADVGRSLSQTASEFDLPMVMQGLRAVAGGATPALNDDEFKAARAVLVGRMQQKAGEAAQRNKREGEEFLIKNKTAAGVMSTRTGLQYQVLRDATGQRPDADTKVRVNYEGRTLDGKVFDASKGGPVEFPLKAVIAGWTEGLQLMPVGAKYRFWIPSQLAYGSTGSPPMIPPNATLVFDVELIGLSR